MSGKNALDFFKLFIDETMLASVVWQTNLYAEQYFDTQGHSTKPSSRVRAWHPTDIAEMKKLISIIFITNLLKY